MRWTYGCSKVAPQGPSQPSQLGMAVSDDPKPVGLPLDNHSPCFDSSMVEETPLQQPSTVTPQPAGAASPPRPSARQPTQDTHLLKLTQDILTSSAWNVVQPIGYGPTLHCV